MGLSSKEVSEDGSDWRRQTSLLQAPPLELRKPIKQEKQHDQNSKNLKCPRCGSSNTKFCYYNNYNKSQPRHFCKTCKRHWTKGGTLRNVPVGGGRNKNKRLKTSKNDAKAALTCQVLDQKQKVALTSDNSQSPFLQDDSVSVGCSNNNMFLDFCSTTTPSVIPQSDHLTFQFPFQSSSPSSLDANPCSFHSSRVNYRFSGEIKEDPSKTSMIMPMTSTGGIMDKATYWWNWDDIDRLVSTDFNIPWDDSDIKS